MLREQDRLLPLANIGRLMARELPEGAKVSKDAKVLMQEMASEFICFLTSEANDISLEDQRKSIAHDDILDACGELGKLQPPRFTCLARPHPASVC
jgi:histone H3/H4